jgi:2-polyprenyl-6-methoxyphenol hydroxylase-like FAD-dependent oxidoreductase
MRVVVCGAGVAGLTSALALGRAGHDVLLLERDATPMPANPHEAFRWPRRGAPQVRHSHALLARLRNTLAERAPDVLADLLAAGATEIAFCDALPETLTDRDPRPGDEQLVALACRRTTFEWVLRKAALREANVELRDGVAVTGLVTAPGDGRAVPHVRGVRVATEADDEVLRADLVVDAGGPRSAGRDWLVDIGVVPPPDQVVDTGIVYLSRFYELIDGAEPPVVQGPIVGELGYLKFAIFPGDNRTFSITLAVGADDRELRARLADAGTFERAAAAIPAAQPWRDGRSAPITGIELMAGLRNRRRTFVVDGAPVATGFVAVGDASVCTNPIYGRGCSLAVVHAFGLADAVAASEGDPTRLALGLHECTRHELDPWYRAAVQQDRESQELHGGTYGPDGTESHGATEAATAAPTDDAVDPKAWAREVFREGMLPALRTSPVVFRAFLRWFNLLSTPDALLRDNEVLRAALESYQDRANHPIDPVPGPVDRGALVAALDAAPAQ